MKLEYRYSKVSINFYSLKGIEEKEKNSKFQFQIAPHNYLANPHLPFPSSIQFEHRPTKKFSFSIDELARGAADNELKARRLSYRELVTEKSIGYEKRSMKIAAACQTSTVARRGKGHRLSSVSIKFPSSRKDLEILVYHYTGQLSLSLRFSGHEPSDRGSRRHSRGSFFTRRRKELDIPELEDL